MLIEQGTADTTVFPNFTDQLVTELKANGVKVTYKTYAGVDHGGRRAQREAPPADATKFVEEAGSG